MNNLIIFILGIIPLIYFSWKDIQKSQLNNTSILLYGLVALFLLWTNKQLNEIGIIILISIINFFLFYELWTIKIIGGADVKLIPFLTIFICMISEYPIYSIIIYNLLLMLIGCSYSLISKTIIKNKYIPFIPIFSLTYLVNYLFWTIKY